MRPLRMKYAPITAPTATRMAMMMPAMAPGLVPLDFFLGGGRTLGGVDTVEDAPAWYCGPKEEALVVMALVTAVAPEPVVSTLNTTTTEDATSADRPRRVRDTATTSVTLTISTVFEGTPSS